MSLSIKHPNLFLPFFNQFPLLNFQGEVPTEPRPMAETNNMTTFDRPPVIERLHNNVGKRKSTTPQKFVGGYLKHSQLVNASLCAAFQWFSA